MCMVSFNLHRNPEECQPLRKIKTALNIQTGDLVSQSGDFYKRTFFFFFFFNGATGSDGTATVSSEDLEGSGVTASSAEDVSEASPAVANTRDARRERSWVRVFRTRKYVFAVNSALLAGSTAARVLAIVDVHLVVFGSPEITWIT